MTCMLPMPILARAEFETEAVRSAAEALATMPATNTNAAHKIPKFFMVVSPKLKTFCIPARGEHPSQDSKIPPRTHGQSLTLRSIRPVK
jgi:hypothetical protein